MPSFPLQHTLQECSVAAKKKKKKKKKIISLCFLLLRLVGASHTSHIQLPTFVCGSCADFFLEPVKNEELLTVASTGLKVLHGLTERVALPVQTPAVVNARRVVISVYRRWTLTAVS